MDSYLEYINQLEKRLVEIDKNMADKELELELLNKKKQQNELLLTDLANKLKHNNDLKKLISNFPKLKIRLIKIFVLFGILFLLPPTLILGTFSLITESLLLLIVTLGIDTIIIKKVQDDYKDKLNDLNSKIDGVSNDFLDVNNIIIKSRQNVAADELVKIDHLIYEIKKFITQSISEKQKTNENIIYAQKMREEAISNHCQDKLNLQFNLDKQNGLLPKVLVKKAN